jgi:hypothetical protein
LARAKRTARAEARRRYRAEHPLGPDGLAEDDAVDEGDELDDAPLGGRRATPTRGPAPRPSGSPASGRPVRMGAMQAFRQAYQPADIRGDLKALPELLRSRAVLIPALLVVISAVVLVLAVQLAPGEAGLPGSSASPRVSVTAPATAAPASPATSPGASPAPSGAASGGAQTVAGSPLGIIASIMALLFLGIPSPPAIGGIYLSAILAKRSSYLAGGIAGLLGSLGALAAVIVISPQDASGSVAVFGQILLTSVVFGVLIGAGLGYYRRLLRLMNPTPNRPANRPKPSARRR